MLLVVVLLGALTLAAIRGFGSGPASSSQDDGAGGGPAPSITPGATDTESHIDQRPGGQGDNGGSGDEDDADGDGDAGGDTGDDGSGGGADGEDGEGSEGSDGDASDDTGEDTDGANGGSDGAGSGGSRVAALPDCAGSDGVTASLRSDQNSYAPGERPTIRLTVRNETADPCKTDVGHESLGLRLTTEGDRVWTSAHCPAGAASLLREVPAGGSASHVVEWDGRYSSRDACDGPSGPTAPTGTYLAEADLDGFAVIQTTFRMDED